MKKAGYSKTTKASLVSRGLAAKQGKPRRKVKSSKPLEAEVGYSLYTDSEDQASAVEHGLDRCAALLSNILDNESSDQGQKKTSNANISFKTVKGGMQEKKHPHGKRTPRTVKHVVVPTAPNNQQVSPSPSKVTQDIPRREPPPRSDPSTVYNDRLVSSTPMLNADERERQQRLLKREKELTEQLEQLKQHYQLLQSQRSPELQDQQKRELQNSMLHELDDYQAYTNRDTSSAGRDTAPEQDISRSTTGRTPKARRSLEYATSLGGLLAENRNQSESTPAGLDSQEMTTSGKRQSFSRHYTSPGYTEHEYSERTRTSDDRDFERERQAGSIKKQVRIASPAIELKRTNPSLRSRSPNVSREGLATENDIVHETSLAEEGGTKRSKRYLSASPTSRGSPPTSAVDSQTKTLKYLIRELREVVGNTDDLEVDRLLVEIDHTASLLPYMLASHSPSQSANVEGEMAAQPLRFENAQLRRKLRIANQKLQEHETLQHSLDDLKSGHTTVSIELAACKSENASLQKQVQNEKERNEKLRSSVGNLEKVVRHLKEDKANFMSILQNKEHDYTKGRRSSQLQASRLSVEVNQLKSELEACRLSSEATEKENTILNLALKQKDTEIDRLGDLARSLQQSMKRVLLDVQEYHPDSVVKQQLVKRQPDILEKMGVTFEPPTRLTTPVTFQPDSMTAVERDITAVKPRPITTYSSVEVKKSLARINEALSRAPVVAYEPEDIRQHMDNSRDRPLLRGALDATVNAEEDAMDINSFVPNRYNGRAHNLGTRRDTKGNFDSSPNSQELLLDKREKLTPIKDGLKMRSKTVPEKAIHSRHLSGNRGTRELRSPVDVAHNLSPLRPLTSPKTAFDRGHSSLSPSKSLAGPGYLDTLSVLGTADSTKPVTRKNVSVELSSLSSGDEEEFQRDLASLDADIARIQQSLRQTALKT